MKVETAINRIKSAGHDISQDLDDYRCLEFLNTSLQQVSSLLIAAQYPALVKEMVVHNGDELPKNYMKSAGLYPLRMTNGKAEIIDGSESVRFRYWATPEMMALDDKELPYSHDAVNEVVVRGAIILAINEDEYDITQDTALITSLQQAIASAMA